MEISSISNVDLAARAEQKQIQKALERERIRDTNKVEFTKNAAEIATYNQEVTKLREAKVLKKVSSESNLELTQANENLNKIETNLNEIKDLIAKNLEGNTAGNTRDRDQLRINELVTEIQYLASYRVDGRKIFGGNFTNTFLGGGTTGQVTLDFTNNESDVLASAKSTEPVTEVRRESRVSDANLSEGSDFGIDSNKQIDISGDNLVFMSEEQSSVNLAKSSNEAVSLAARTFEALADISLSETLASLSGETNLATEEDLYDIGQMLANLKTMRDTLSDSMEEVEADSMLATVQTGSIERRLKRYAYYSPELQANVDKSDAESLLGLNN
ncbi:MAG: hypothetical protein MK033_03405 [Candidatus Caenarcaniphilales bacterium]|nr:hypothetical protein [Candidatus Caenarcaniphilales bacterium]